MKLLSVKIDDELHKQLKIFAIQQEKTMAEIVIELVKKELETKKEQSRWNFGEYTWLLKNWK